MDSYTLSRIDATISAEPGTGEGDIATTQTEIVNNTKEVIKYFMDRV